MNSKKTSLTALTTAAVLGATGMPAVAQEVMAKVLNTTAVMQQVAVPRQVCSNQQVIQQSQPSGAGAAIGAVAGGAIGSTMGSGSGRDLATVIGFLGGAVLGNKIEGNRDEVRNVQQCTTQTTYENRVLHYEVVYEYDNKRYSIRMPNDPGPYVRLQLNPVGALPSAPATSTVVPSPVSVAPAPITTITHVQPHAVYAPPVQVQPHAVYAPPLHVHTMISPPYTVVYPPIRYAPVAPIGLSLNWSHHGGRHHGRRWH